MQWRCLTAARAALVLLFACAPTASAAQPTAPSSSEDDLEVPAPASSAPPGKSSPPPPVAPASEATPPAPAPTAPSLVPSSPAAPPAPPEDAAGEIAELRARVQALETKAAAEPAHPTVRSDPPAPNAPTTSLDASPWSRSWPRGLVLGGYVQAQYQQSQASQDQLDANGTPLNQNRFLVRRARLRLDRGWDYASATLEVDGNNVNGLAFGLRRAEVSLLLRAPEPSAPPFAALTVGLTSIPFGYELYEPNLARIFLERTTGSRAFFPGDTDFAGTLGGAIGFFRYAVGVFDGTPVPDSEPNAIGFDPTEEKDFMARFGAETQPAKDLGVSGGVSFVGGSGFHAGTAATKATLQWQDTNQNGVVDAGEIVGIPGQAATPSQTFSHWAAGVDLQLRLRTPIGRALLYGEAYVGSNFDRGLFMADPVETGINLREIGWYVAYVQEVTRYGLVGFRVDSYNPNADATTQLAGTLLPLDQTITTWSPLVGLVLPERARLVFEYDHIQNHQGLAPNGVPVDLPDDQWAVRLQVQM
jgi:hypothetical protein